MANVSPWHQADLPWDEVSGWDGIPWDRRSEPSLDKVLMLRRAREFTWHEDLVKITMIRLMTARPPGNPGLKVTIDSMVTFSMSGSIRHSFSGRANRSTRVGWQM